MTIFLTIFRFLKSHPILLIGMIVFLSISNGITVTKLFFRGRELAKVTEKLGAAELQIQKQSLAILEQNLSIQNLETKSQNAKKLAKAYNDLSLTVEKQARDRMVTLESAKLPTDCVGGVNWMVDQYRGARP